MCCFGAVRPLSTSTSLRAGFHGPARVCRAFHAFYLPDCRTDPRSTAACGLDRGARSGRPLVPGIVAVLPKSARRPRNGAGVRQGIPGRNRTRPAFGSFVSLFFSGGPPGALAGVRAFGGKSRVGTDPGPPLAFWLADIAFRAAGNHLFGVYLLAELCAVATFWALYLLARSV